MSNLAHKIYIFSLSSIVVVSFFLLLFYGFDYYNTPLQERFYHENHDWFKPSGILGHGIGIIGTLLILFGVSMYIIRKRNKRFAKLGRLKHWLEFHIFLCTLGPVLVLFHTAFKFGGIVSISFWSMVLVVISGIIGRFIYIQIPRSIEGRELSLHEIHDLKTGVEHLVRNNKSIPVEDADFILSTTRAPKNGLLKQKVNFIKRHILDKRSLNKVRSKLKKVGISKKERKSILKIVKNEIDLNQKIDRLHVMQRLFRYWHVAHLPFAIIMLLILILHVGITLAFGYKWIF